MIGDVELGFAVRVCSSKQEICQRSAASGHPGSRSLGSCKTERALRHIRRILVLTFPAQIATKLKCVSVLDPGEVIFRVEVLVVDPYQLAGAKRREAGNGDRRGQVRVVLRE